MLEPFPHQENGAKYLLERKKGFLFWKMRTGKTLASIYGTFTSDSLPILVITKPSIMETFRKAFVDDFGIKEDKVGVCLKNYSHKKKRQNSKRP